MTELIVNADEPREKQMLLSKVRDLRGRWRIAFTQHRPRRTDRQNRMYWPCVVQPFADFLRSQGESYTDDDAHEFMKAKFLMRDVIDPRTGEIVGQIPQSTTKLNTEEFYDYVEKCVAWLADMFGIQCPSPEPYRQADRERVA